MTTIEYCLNNVDRNIREQLTDLDCTIENRCLQRCGDCYRDDLLVVDGELYTDESHTKLLEKIEVSDE